MQDDEALYEHTETRLAQLEVNATVAVEAINHLNGVARETLEELDRLAEAHQLLTKGVSEILERVFEAQRKQQRVIDALIKSTIENASR